MGVLIVCRGCGLERMLRRRDMCKACYARPEVRSTVAPRTGTAPGGILATEPTGEPTTPTMAPIGSPWKMRVMAARAAAGLGVFHPDDNPTAFLMVSEKFWRRVFRRWQKLNSNTGADDGRSALRQQ